MSESSETQRRRVIRRIGACLTALLSLAACGTGDREPALFKLLTPQQTGVTFANTITTSDSLNVQTDVYVYNGAGVAVGDIDNDGLSDIFFAGNMVSSGLYLNKGNMRFEDITGTAGVSTKRWATGASIVDINNDGFLDIYVSVSGRERSQPEERANLLFLNNGNRTFTEAAAQFGVDDRGFTTHSVFLDYDGDGCLDLFVLNNSPADFSRVEVTRHPAAIRGDTPGSYNQLYRNTCAGSFRNVSQEAGILREAGYGLGVVVGDLNRDGWPDIYVSNDGTPNDVVYVNNGNGSFANKAARWLKHSSYAGMGVDVADFNNDGWPDILQVDMMPRELSRRKRTTGYLTYASLMESRARGFRIDYSENTLQLSNGLTTEGDVLFSDVAHLAGIAATDWSWSALFADFDNDGFKDIFISSGYPKAVNDLDYQIAMFGVRRGDSERSRRIGLDMLGALHSYEEPNYFFKNNGDLTFSDKSKAWGVARRGFSYGAAYADLNNDGKLDLVVNNIDAPAFVYENVAPSADDAHHYVQVTLQGESPNRRGIGAHLILTANGQKQHIYQSPYRGYMSSSDERVQFGLGNIRRVERLEVLWPDGRYQVLTDLDVDRLVVVKQSDAMAKIDTRSPTATERLFEPLGTEIGLTSKHQVGALLDYSSQPLLPYMISRQGPALAVGDVNGDSLDDVFVGGAARFAGQLFIQQKNGTFVSAADGQAWEADKAQEDWGALFVDANGDGRRDLYVASGGYHLTNGSALLQDRLYINQGNGRFAKDIRALPSMLTSKATVRAGDFDGDGKIDLFVGGRLSPQNYPYPTRSYVLRGNGRGFTDVTQEVAPELVQPGGMVTDAVWVDFNGDGRLDLVTVGEWMSIEFYRNDGKRLHNVTKSTRLPPMRGWWFSLAAGDFDKDGRIDLIAGNLGLNYGYSTSRASKFGVYAADFTGNRTTNVVLTQEIDGVEYPITSLGPLGSAMYPLTLRFPTYGAFARVSMRDAFGAAALKQALHYQTDTFASVYLHNAGNGTFEQFALPSLAQIAPLKAIVPNDVDGDGHLDLLVAGNLYDAEPNTGRADAGNGLWLKGDGKGHFAPVSPRESGFLAPLNVQGLALVRTPTGQALIVANANDSLQAFMIRK